MLEHYSRETIEEQFPEVSVPKVMLEPCQYEQPVPEKFEYRLPRRLTLIELKEVAQFCADMIRINPSSVASISEDSYKDLLHWLGQERTPEAID